MIVIKYFTAVLIMFWFIQCTHKPKPLLLTIEEMILLDSIPSASGMVLRNDSIFIISDDAPYIFQLSLKDFGFKKIALNGAGTNQYRISKKLKQDLESAAIARVYGKEYLFAFGSGSLSPTRDSMVIMDLTDQKPFSISTGDLFKTMQVSTYTKQGAWNIEGASVFGDSLYLLNRAKNQVIVMPVMNLAGVVIGNFQSPKFMGSHFAIKLPSIGKREAKFSGLAAINNELGLFCASVEDAPDWISDGPILGSYIGIINIKKRQVLSTFLLADSLGKPMLEKLESVEFISKNANGELLILAITDNDNGSSKLFRIKLPAKSIEY